MPAKALWLLQIPEIVSLLKTFDVPVVDRAIIERLFGLRRRRFRTRAEHQSSSIVGTILWFALARWNVALRPCPAAAGACETYSKPDRQRETDSCYDAKEFHEGLLLHAEAPPCFYSRHAGRLASAHLRPAKARVGREGWTDC